ncbi:23S rRNA (guanosine(2251)-2'-O)-methyltransferase RlmB [uncultured Negativibacillus sp.]|uniref:23S rRNA (guanosine(2251)-2'-O)-methyltransferase RlmB n=1 Tax=uncultured Negativibacillus sp. TaxID=1980696 RepID=UPI0025E6C081|nr:23S rRNA (guanosine(2251)-2'-O)-methyltransferase RlmB [uncultured Negativibacillus sp.]
MPREFASEKTNQESSVIAGRNAVTEALKKGRPIDCIYILKGADRGSMGKIVALAKERGIPIKDAAAQKLDSLCDGVVHQGVAAMAACHDFSTMEDIFEKAGDQPPFIIICDNIEDPHNLGAIIRTAEAAGAHGVIIPKRRGVGLTATVAKTSAGAIEYMPVVRVANIVSTIEELKQKGLWIFCADMDGQPWCSTDMSGPIGVVVGAEGNGVSRLTKEHCDFVVSLPMNGQVNSLNASVAAAIVIYEAVRQRSGLRSFVPKN